MESSIGLFESFPARYEYKSIAAQTREGQITPEELSDALGGDRRLTICRELTKRHEEKLQMTLADSLSYYEVNEPRGEYVLIIAGRSREEMKKEEQAGWEALSLEEHMAHYESQGIDRKEAMKRVAKDRGVSKRDIYQALLK